MAKDYDKVAALYSSTDLSFLPSTYCLPPVHPWPALHQGVLHGVSQELPDDTITADNVQNYGEDAYLHTGLPVYTFLTCPANTWQPVEARFSYMWRKVDGAW
jgi:hypothetical protein